MISDTAPAWRKSSYSHGADANCVEVADLGDQEGVRDTKDKGMGPVLTFQPGQISALAAAIKTGQFGFSSH
jgi:hypothetical protein